jgi:quinolinate synthase
MPQKQFFFVPMKTWASFIADRITDKEFFSTKVLSVHKAMTPEWSRSQRNIERDGLMHPSVRPATLALADFIGSNSPLSKGAQKAGSRISDLYGRRFLHECRGPVREEVFTYPPPDRSSAPDETHDA